MAQSLNRTLFIADNLPVLRGIDSESIDLIATDPPFNKGVKAFEGITKAGVNVEYKDVWTWGDVQDGWTKAILSDHPKLHSVIQAANAGGGRHGSVPVLARRPRPGNAPCTQTHWQPVSPY